MLHKSAQKWPESASHLGYFDARHLFAFMSKWPTRILCVSTMHSSRPHRTTRASAVSSRNGEAEPVPDSPHSSFLALAHFSSRSAAGTRPLPPWSAAMTQRRPWPSYHEAPRAKMGGLMDAGYSPGASPPFSGRHQASSGRIPSSATSALFPFASGTSF